MKELVMELNDYLNDLEVNFSLVIEEVKKYSKEKNVVMLKKSRAYGERLLDEIDRVRVDMGLNKYGCFEIKKGL